MKQRTPTRAEVVLRDIKADVLNGRLTPGSQLGFAALGQRYSASTGVLREVLPRLVEQGLATSQPQLGFRVVSLSIEDLESLTEARIAIETEVLTQSIRHGDLDWEADVVGAHHRLTQLPTLDDDGALNPQWLEVHRRFHQAILEACPNPRLREVAQRLRDISEVYRCWSVRNTEHIQSRDVEHNELASASVERDIAKATRVLTDHIQKTTDHLIESQKRAVIPSGVAPARSST